MEMVLFTSLRRGFYFPCWFLPFQSSYMPKPIGLFQLPSPDFCFKWAAEEKAVKRALFAVRRATPGLSVPVFSFQVYAQNLSRLYDREIKAFFEQAKTFLVGRRKASE